MSTAAVSGVPCHRPVSDLQILARSALMAASSLGLAGRRVASASISSRSATICERYGSATTRPTRVPARLGDRR